MSVDQAVEIGRAAVVMTLLIGSPVMVMAMAVGLIISIFQAVTQIQDQTISMVPKIVAMFLMLFLVFPWLIIEMMQYSEELIRNIPSNF